MMTLLPSGPRLPENTTLPWADAKTSVPRSPAMSIPAWNCFWFVKGDTRVPNLEVNQPLAGQMAGVAARRARLLSS